MLHREHYVGMCVVLEEGPQEGHKLSALVRLQLQYSERGPNGSEVL